MSGTFVYLGAKFPSKKFDKFRVNIQLNETGLVLKQSAAQIANSKIEEIELVYCGDVVEDDVELSKLEIRSGSTIFVLRKQISSESVKYEKFTESDVQRVCSLFRSLSATSFHKVARSEIVKAILDEHPELRCDLVALSVLKDPIILATFSSPDTVRKFAEHHRILIEASETIVRVLKSKNIIELEVPASAMETAGDDQLSDDSSSSGSDNAPASTSRGRPRPESLRRVTSAQLASALMTANSFSNSLSSLSQRNLDGPPEGAQPTTASGSQTNPSGRITNSMFLSALSNVVLSNRRNTEGASNAEPSDSSVPASVETLPVEENNMSMEDADAHSVASYQPALDQMFEMGLRNRSANLQAIMLCNGNLDQAVNLVLSDNGNSY